MHELKTLILSFHSLIAVETVEEERVDLLIKAVASELQLKLYTWSITQGLVRHDTPKATVPRTNQPMGLLQHLASLDEGIFLLKDLHPHLKDPTVVRQFREVSQRFAQSHASMVLTGPSLDLPPELDAEAVFYNLELPNREELYEALQAVVRSLNTKQEIKLDLEAADLGAVLQALQGLTLNQARQVIAYAALTDNSLSKDDLAEIQARKIQFLQEGGLLEYFPAEDNASDIGGFQVLKDWLARAKLGFSSQAQSLNLSPPKGIMIVGVQGCGKSLSAKVTARNWGLPLLKLDAGRLYDKYVGESERNFRKATQTAESMAPVVLWIDEIEKSFAQGQSMDSGTSRRLFGSFLTWLQEKRADVFVIATANDISELPPELMRKGRFDEIFFVDLPNAESRATIFHIHLSRRKQQPEQFDLPLLVEATAGFSGAEIEQAVVAGLYRSLHLDVSLNTAILQAEISSTVPLSISRKEDVARLRQMAAQRFVSVD
ncbi:MAG: AAA family ATPase [Synechococcales cyanobacterium RM1_1_8]|nr:AAA family ATPase [Synechococcales cyanobacterium RM1_1_8]